LSNTRQELVKASTLRDVESSSGTPNRQYDITCLCSYIQGDDSIHTSPQATAHVFGIAALGRLDEQRPGSMRHI
jgi:hypothetical protein